MVIQECNLYKLYISSNENILNIPAPGGAGSVIYRSDCIINKGIYDIYVGNGANNDNNISSHTIGFGATAYGVGLILFWMALL